MKSDFTYLKVFALALYFLIPRTAAAQIEITFNLSRFEGGYNVSCHGGSDGDLEAIAIGDYGPFYYQWSNGATTSSIHNLQAGIYSVTVTDFSNHTKFKTVELFQPNGMTVILNPSSFEGGTNISENGGSNGVIRTEIHGGTPPYKFLWSNGSTNEEINDLPVGTYSVTVTDATNCFSSASYTLIEPTALHIVSITSANHNGFNISCYESHDGSIDLTVAGGIPPYSFQWNNGSFDQNPSGLSNGLFLVRVFDQNGAEIDGQIALTQPNKLSLTLSPSFYNSNNISCYGCANGSIQTNVSGGVSPLNYQWSNSQTTANISSLTFGTYSLTVTDLNGCSSGNSIVITQPDREDWTMGGNANTNPANQFIGTKDSTDLVFKTNSSIRIKIKSNGKINLSNLSKGYATELWIDSLGNIFAKAPGIGNSCHANYFPLPLPSWQVAVDNIDNQGGFLYTCADDIKVGIGTLLKKNKLDVAGNIAIGLGWAGTVDAPTDGMLVKGNVGIGTSYIPANYKLAVNGKIISEEVFVKLRTSWPDYVFNSDYKLIPLIELKKFINQNNHLPEIKSSKEIENADGISVGETQMILLKKIEELTLYIIQQDEKVNKMQTQIEQLQKK